MGLFNFFKKKQIKVQQEIQETPEPQLIPGKRFIENECELCKKVIGQEPWSKHQGKFFHKKCYKKALTQFRSTGTIKI